MEISPQTVTDFAFGAAGRLAIEGNILRPSFVERFNITSSSEELAPEETWDVRDVRITKVGRASKTEVGPMPNLWDVPVEGTATRERPGHNKYFNVPVRNLERFRFWGHLVLQISIGPEGLTLYGGLTNLINTGDFDLVDRPRQPAPE